MVAKVAKVESLKSFSLEYLALSVGEGLLYSWSSVAEVQTPHRESLSHLRFQCACLRCVLGASVFLLVTIALTVQAYRVMGQTVGLLPGPGLAAHVRVEVLKCRNLALLKSRKLKYE